MKQLIILLALMLSIPVSAEPGNEKAISVGSLPQTAQLLITTHFANRKVAIAKVETGFFSKSYDVIFTNGDKIEFDGRGNWTEIKCKRSAVPASLVPEKIARFVRENYPDCNIIEIEKEDGEIEVSLSNNLEITFNKRLEVIEID